MGASRRGASGSVSLVLITGISGFLGRWVVPRLVARGWRVAGLSRRPIVNPAMQHYAGDFTDVNFMRSVLSEVRPDVLLHFAGVIPGGPGGDMGPYEVNVLGTVRLFQSVVDLHLDPLVLVTSSSAVYGRPSELPVREDHPFKPLTAYASSKAAQELIAIQYYEAHRLRTIRVRTFNMVGPGQPATLVTSEMAEQVARAEASDGGSLRLGNLEARRDFTDVRDIAAAVEALIDFGEAGQVYNVCSGLSRSVKECADIILGLARVPVSLVTEEARIRASEIPDQVGSAERLRVASGWRPTYALEESLADLLDEWRQWVQRGA
ncbi:MAG: hypothetical protein A3H27_03850 [Acidobacteria bacterium RIFCSPLOWO2_02_FULL_59_13]|nr:MAG: hypothetical protein A3H27_03850 [Acidobacteria bacterium RIFCSPLOWO2_02_FULL_59_13]